MSRERSSRSRRRAREADKLLERLGFRYLEEARPVRSAGEAPADGAEEGASAGEQNREAA